MMEAIVVLGGIVVVVGAVWTAGDLARDCGVEPQQVIGNAQYAARKSALRADQACSALRSRAISSSTACRADMSQCRIS
jgi:hypothetical protein